MKKAAGFLNIMKEHVRKQYNGTRVPYSFQ